MVSKTRNGLSSITSVSVRRPSNKRSTGVTSEGTDPTVLASFASLFWYTDEEGPMPLMAWA
jgi:hypothetical protein